jgi:hypothetical protein
MKLLDSLFSSVFDGNTKQRMNRVKSSFGANAIVETLEIPLMDYDATQQSPVLQNAATMVALWKAASASLSRTVSQPNKETIVWVLPMHVDANVVQNWVEIYAWWLAETEDGRSNNHRVEYVLVEDSIPCASFTLQTSNSRNSMEASRQAYDRSEYQAIIRHDDETILTINQATRSWVKRILVEQQICPFTKSSKYSGHGLADLNIPVARIDYVASDSQTLPELLTDTWTAMFQMLQAGSTETSSILLAAPAWNNDFASWAGPVFAVLEASVVAARAEAELGVVCFHPQYKVSDGSVFCGFGQMHSLPRLEQWVRDPTQEKVQQQQDHEHAQLSSSDIAAGGAFQRRTPHATINVLRADQLQAAETKRSSADLYRRNVHCLNEIGWDKLQNDLEAEQQMVYNEG